MTENTTLQERLIDVGRDGYVTADEVIALRGEIFPDGVVDRQELAGVFRLAERAPEGDREWRHFFVEVCADFFLNEEEPCGYVTSEEFNTLEQLVTRDGRVASALELHMLLELQSNAVSTPPEMFSFIADQLRQRLLFSETPSMDDDATEMVRQFLYSAGGDGAIGITRAEAELLFDLHDATASAPNCDAWRELFVKAMAAHLMQFVGYKPLPREEALRLQDWKTDHSTSVGGFMGRMVSGGLSAIIEAYRKEPVADQSAAVTAAAEITGSEADWLADRIGRNGQVDEAEQALLRYLQELDAALPPRLSDLAKAAR